HDFSSSIPSELKKIPLKVSEINGAVRDMENPPKTTLQPEGEQVRDKGKKDVSHEEIVKEESESDSNVEIRLSEEIENQMDIENTIKVDAAKSKIKKVKQDWIDFMGLKVVEKIYKDMVKYDGCIISSPHHKNKKNILEKEITRERDKEKK
nr:hypothetical protein [Tanacetum cinerariifolium]